MLFSRRLNWKLFSPLRALRDLRLFLHTRKPYELWFLGLAMVLTLAAVLALDHDATFQREYKPPTIIYVQQWRADRTDAEIIAQQKIDGPKEKAAKEAAARSEAKRLEGVRRLDKSLDRLGL